MWFLRLHLHNSDGARREEAEVYCRGWCRVGQSHRTKESRLPKPISARPKALNRCWRGERDWPNHKMLIRANKALEKTIDILLCTTPYEGNPTCTSIRAPTKLWQYVPQGGRKWAAWMPYRSVGKRRSSSFILAGVTGVSESSVAASISSTRFGPS